MIAEEQAAVERITSYFAAHPGPEGFSGTDLDVQTLLTLVKRLRTAEAEDYERCAARLEHELPRSQFVVAEFRLWAKEARNG